MGKSNLHIKSIGLTAYADALSIQEQVHAKVASGGLDTLILCEHPHVYTFGKSADRSNLLINADFLNQLQAETFETDRGGDITYHGPGQLVGYPIINLRKHGIGVKRYVDSLEASIIQALQKFNIHAYQLEKLTGIWVGGEGELKRKIGAIGIRVKNGVSMHGFALNVNTDLSYFQHIVPCGIADKAVTSISQEIGKTDIASFSDEFVRCFERQWHNAIALQPT